MIRLRVAWLCSSEARNAGLQPAAVDRVPAFLPRLDASQDRDGSRGVARRRAQVSGSWDKTLRLWECATGDCKRVLRGHSAGVNAVAVLPDGRAVSGGLDRTLRVWDTSAGVCERLLEGHQARAAPVLSLSCFPCFGSLF